MTRVALIGSGSWATAIAHLLAGAGNAVTMWTRRPEDACAVNESGRNLRHLPDVGLFDTSASPDLSEVLAGADAIVFATPSSFLRDVARRCASFVAPDAPIIVLTKGIEADTGFTMVELLADVLGNRGRIACLSGPNHAEEVSRDLPAATVVASSDAACARYFQGLFSTPTFRVYTSSDVTGVELCAATKNVIAIANGMSVAMDLGDNASASLMTRGLAEVTRLVDALGGDPITCLGLAGMGDLVATCSSVHSRNRSLGACIVEGDTLEAFEERSGMVAEGAVACRTVTDLARRHGVEMPIAETVRRVLWEGLDPHDAIEPLLDRPVKAETE